MIIFLRKKHKGQSLQYSIDFDTNRIPYEKNTFFQDTLALFHRNTLLNLSKGFFSYSLHIHDFFYGGKRSILFSIKNNAFCRSGAYSFKSLELLY